MEDCRPAIRRITVSVGESVRILRELQELSQSQLARLTGISQATIPAIENDRVRLGVERAKVLARVLKCHPGVLVFPGWQLPDNAAASHVVPPDLGSAVVGPRPLNSAFCLKRFMCCVRVFGKGK